MRPRRMGWCPLALAALLGLLSAGCTLRVFDRRAWPETDLRRVRYLVQLTSSPVRETAGGELALPPLPEDARAVRPEEAGAPAVILLDERIVSHGSDFQGNQFTVVDVRRAVRLDDPSAVDAAQVRLVFEPYELLHGLIAETQTADGRDIPVEKMNSFDLTRYFKTQPARAIAFAFPQVEPGAIVRWAYRIRLPGRRSFDAWQAPDDLPVRSAAYRLRGDGRVVISVQTEGLAPASGEVDGVLVREWTVRDLPYDPRRPGDAPRVGGRAGLRLAMKHEKQGGVDWRTTLTGVDDTPEGWTALLREMHADALDENTRLPAALATPGPGDAPPLEAAWRRVHERLAEGVTPLAPHRDGFSAFVHYRRATAGDRVGLLYTLLDRWGVDCDLVYTSPRGTEPIDDAFAMPARGGRTLLSCGEVLLDPACEGCAPGQIGPDVRGRPAMKLGAGAAEMISLPDDPVPPIERRYTIELTDRGLVAREGEVVLHDTDAARVRAWLRDHPLPPERIAEDAGEVFLDGIEAARIGVSGHEVPTGPVRFALENVLISRGAFARGAQWATVPLEAVFDEPVLALAEVESRRRPVALTAGMGFVNALHLPAGEGWAVVRGPEPTVIESPFGTYRLTRDGADGLQLTETLTVTPSVVPAEDWPALRAFLAGIAAHRRAPAVLRRAAEKKVAAVE